MATSVSKEVGGSIVDRYHAGGVFEKKELVFIPSGLSKIERRGAVVKF